MEDVADQAVGQSCEQNSLKKLPDLVPDVPISEPADEQVDQQQLVERPASSQNEDSEYESADDEFPLQGSIITRLLSLSFSAVSECAFTGASRRCRRD